MAENIRHHELATLSAEAAEETQADNNHGDDAGDENDGKTTLIDLLNQFDGAGTVALVGICGFLNFFNYCADLLYNALV